MKLHPRVTRSLLELVKRFEGLRRRAARLPDGGWTIGYGHVRSAREGAVVSPADADALLYYDLSEVAEKVEAWTFAPLNQNQFEALTAFAFNIGVDNFRQSTVLKRVNEGQHLAAAALLELWRKSNFGGEDIVIDALVRRRAAEKAHYLTPPEGYRPSPTPVLKPALDHSAIEAAAAARAGRAAVVDAPLHGDQACATLEAEIETPDDDRTTDFAKAATLTGLAATPTPQVYPDQAAATEADKDGAPDLFGLEGDHGPNQDEASSPTDVPFGDYAASSQMSEAPANVPSPVETAHQPAAMFDIPASQSLSVVEPMRSIFLAGGPEAPHRLDDALQMPKEGADAGDGLPRERPYPQPLIFFAAGLLGVVLFVVALVSMFNGKANLANLVVGLVGIAAIMAAGGYFLLRFLKKHDGLVEI
jgi:lysozyme